MITICFVTHFSEIIIVCMSLKEKLAEIKHKEQTKYDYFQGISYQVERCRMSV